MKNIRKKTLKTLLLGSFIAMNLFILFESMLPSGQSTQTSMSWTNFFASIAEFFGNDKAKIVEPESVEITGFETIILGESKRLTANILPETTTDKSVKWESSDDMVAEVTSGGIVVAKALGSFRVTATSSVESVLSYINLSVVDYPIPDSFSLFTERTEIFIGTTTTIELGNLFPEKASKEQVVWSSAPSNVASVNAYGVVKGLSEGVAAINATSGSFSRNVNISVSESPTPVIAPSLLNIVGESTGYIYRNTQLSADLGEFPPTDTSVTWLSSDENIARVDKTGEVFGTKFEGTVTITAIANADETVRDTFEMTIEPVFPTSFIISSDNLTVVAGNTINLTPTFDPLDVTSKEIIWTSSNESVATVASKGDYAQVLGLKSGNVTIYASSKMDESVVAQIDLEVLKAAVLTPDDRAELNNFIRKALGHFALFFADGVMAFVVFHFFASIPLWKKLLFSLGIGTFVAAFSEILQLATEGRSGKFMDVLLDCFGFFSAVFLSLLAVHLLKKRKENRKHRVDLSSE